MKAIAKLNFKVLASLILVLLLLAGCVPISEHPAWDRVTESAKGTSVDFYIWRGDLEAIAWFKDVVKEHMQVNYDITLNIIEIEKKDYLAKLRDDKLHERPLSDGDLLWVTAEEFSQFKSEGLLYGPFSDQLLNTQTYLGPRSIEANYVDGTLAEGYAVPFNQEQICFFFNEDMVFDPPTDLESLKLIVGENPGLFTYPSPSDPLGGYFVRSVILALAPSDKAFVEGPLTDAQLLELVRPGLEYLKSLKSNLYKSGQVYPATALELQDLFANQEVFITMSMDYRHAHGLTGDAIYPGGTRPFYLPNVGTGPRDHLAIPFGAKNKSGAMVVMNGMLDLKLQTAKLQSKAYRGLPPYDFELIQKADAAAITKAAGRKTIPNINKLLEARMHDIPSQYHGKILELWKQIVLAPTP